MTGVPRSNGRVGLLRDNGPGRIPLKVLAVIPLTVLLVFSGCARSPQTAASTTTTTAPKATTTTAATTAATTAPATTTKTTAAPPPVSTPTGPYGALKIAVANFEQESFEAPVVGMDGSSLTYPVFDQMFWLEKGDLKPAMVEKWVIAPDAISWTYTLRKGVKFHNGDPFTADDLIFTVDRYLDEKSRKPLRSYLVGLFKTVEKKDD
ncbi:MAG: hypothetical protein HYY32_02805, partial [Chloroflexi bacterium]|nr:hypothetical protein [Chloroflexota bacterium]